MASVQAFSYDEDEQVAASIALVQDSLVPCRLCNTASVPVVFQRGMQVGTLKICQ